MQRTTVPPLSAPLFPYLCSPWLLFIPASNLLAVPGVSSIHEMHIWELINGKSIATLHVKYDKDRGYQDASQKIRELFHQVGIHNVTIQFEQVDRMEPPGQDTQALCSSPCISGACKKHLCCPPRALPLTHVNGCAEHNGCPPGANLGRQAATHVAISLTSDGVSDGGHPDTRTQENQQYVNSTHF